MKVLIDIPDKEYNRIKSKTEVNYSEMWIAEGTPLDGLTNGEVMQKMLPNARYEDGIEYMRVYIGVAVETYYMFEIPLSWWNRKWGE